ncbi:MAG: hypothetical protein J6J18_07055 [Oscillospiraceae bacterium]|nr:hypothetical protein [Oscillospiraceae bacterium]
MKQTLEKLWNGNISPIESCGENDSEIQEILRLIESNRKDLTAELNEHQKEMFGNYTGCCEEYTYLITAQAFCDGFSLASRIWAETLAET